MRRNIQLAFVLLAVSSVCSEYHRYCELWSCPNRTHTLCQYSQAGWALHCGNVVRIGLMQHEKTIILHLYNSFRPLGPLDVPKQTNSLFQGYLMQWDEELEEIAQRWVDQCITNFDDCRNVDRFFVRQRIGFDITPRQELRPSVYDLVMEWATEDNYNYFRSSVDRIRNYLNIIDRLDTDDESISVSTSTRANQFHRLMWQNENRIGCGAIRAVDDEDQFLYLVCNYGTENTYS